MGIQGRSRFRISPISSPKILLGNDGKLAESDRRFHDLSAALGLPLAYLMRSVKIKGSSFLNILIVISYLSPPFIGAYAWIQMLGRQGVITQFLNDTFGLHYGGVYGFAGIVLVFTLQSFPLVYIYVSGALKIWTTL